METLAIKWSSPKKSPSRTQIFLTDVDRIVPGVDSDFWRVSCLLIDLFGVQARCRLPVEYRVLSLERVCCAADLRTGISDTNQNVMG